MRQVAKLALKSLAATKTVTRDYLRDRSLPRFISRESLVFISRAGRWFDHQTFNCHPNKRNAKRGKIVNNPPFQFPFPPRWEREREGLDSSSEPLGSRFPASHRQYFPCPCKAFEHALKRAKSDRSFQHQLYFRDSFGVKFIFLICHQIPGSSRVYFRFRIGKTSKRRNNQKSSLGSTPLDSSRYPDSLILLFHSLILPIFFLVPRTVYRKYSYVSESEDASLSAVFFRKFFLFHSHKA